MRAVIPVKSRWDAETKNIYYEAAQNLAEWYDKRPRDFDEFYRLRAKIGSCPRAWCMNRPAS
jgi:hypothetical protein